MMFSVGVWFIKSFMTEDIMYSWKNIPTIIIKYDYNLSRLKFFKVSFEL